MSSGSSPSYDSGDLLDACSDGCGWIAAIVAALAYGSFGVPIRGTKHIDVHPLVLQSIKTVTMFAMSWLVIFLNVKPSWTNWGLLSGLLWVLGGTGGIYAIRMAGLAIAVGTWASVMIGVNFVWGILVFQEPVANVWAAMGAFVLLTLGLIGMSKYSAQKQSNETICEKKTDGFVELGGANDIPPTFRGEVSANSTNATTIRDSPLVEPGMNTTMNNSMLHNDLVNIAGYPISKRMAGIFGAVFNGIMTGSSLIPLHYAKKEGFGGAHYMISYASGALIANILLWLLIFLQQYHRTAFASNRSNQPVINTDYQLDIEVVGGSTFDNSILWQVLRSMPPWHLSKIGIPGLIAGVLLAIAMFGSILAVTYLGQGVGNSVIQSKILISGLWGIMWFSEIRGFATISKWFLSASLTVLGILWLSQERLQAVKTANDE